MNVSQLRAIRAAFPDNVELQSFTKCELPPSRFSVEAYTALEHVGLPQGEVLIAKYNQKPADFATVSSLKDRPMRASLKDDQRVIIARGVGSIRCLDSSAPGVLFVVLREEQGDELINSSLTKHLHCLAKYCTFLNALRTAPYNWELTESYAIAFLREIRDIDPDVLNATPNWWEEFIVESRYGEPINWR